MESNKNQNKIVGSQLEEPTSRKYTNKGYYCK